ncbi:unnamed protein product [Sphagnum balticum]
MASGGKEERTSAAQLRAEAKQAGDSASEHAKDSAAEYKQQVHKAGLSALKGAEENYQSAKGTAVEEKDRLLDYATQTKNTATDTVQEYTEAAKKKLGDLGESTQQKYEQTKKQTAETAENALNNEASEPARQAAAQQEDKSSNSQNMYGAVRDNTYDYIEEAKRNLFQGAAAGDHDTTTRKEDSSDTVDEDAAVEGAKGTSADQGRLGAGAVSNTTARLWDTSKEKASESVEAVERKIDHAKDGTKQKISDWTATREGDHGVRDGAASRDGKSTDGLDEGVKQKASQMLGSVQNETADTFSDTQDRKTLSESTAGYTDHHRKDEGAARDADSTWDATVDKTKSREYFEENPGVLSSWTSNVKERASQFLGSTQNETADTLNDSADRATLSESTAAGHVTKPRKEAAEEAAAPAPWDTTRGKTKEPAAASGVAGVNWAGLKLKASQILESFGNETADTFDTVQDRKSISESTEGTTTDQHGGGGASAEADMPFDHTDVKTSVHDKVQEALASAAGASDQENLQSADSMPQSASDNHGDASGGGGGGFTWESLKQKASDVLGGIQLSTPTRTAGDGDQETQLPGENNTGILSDNVNKKLTDSIAAMKERAAEDSASKSLHDTTDFTSETRRATADQVADYADH